MLKPIESQYFLAGHVSRLHGVDGTVLIVPVLEAENKSLFENVDLLYLQNERGDIIPARINSIRVEEKDNRISFFVKFEHITDRTEAEEINGSPVLIEKDKIEDFVSTGHIWTSFSVLNEKNKKIGTVENVVENPAHPILLVSTDDGDLLIPCVEEYIAKVDEAKKVIRCKNLNQLDWNDAI